MHVFKLLLHIPYQFKLSAAALQILLRIADVEIIVAVQIIRQEPDTTSLAQWGRCTDGLLRLSGRACIGTVFRSGSFEFGISLFGFFTFYLHIPRRPFSRRW